MFRRPLILNLVTFKIKYMEHNYTIITALIVGCLFIAIGYYFGYNAGYMQSLEDDMNRRIDEDDLSALDRRIEEAIKQTRNHGK